MKLNERNLLVSATFIIRSKLYEIVTAVIILGKISEN